MKSNKKTVIIFGAGRAGLSAAHQLIKKGYNVTVIETLDGPGGMARSQRFGNTLPTEYSWRGFGPWYCNVYKIMKEIPIVSKFEKNKMTTVYDQELSRHIKFHLTSDTISKKHIESSSCDNCIKTNKKCYKEVLYEIPHSWKCGWLDYLRLYWIFAQGFVSNKRSKDIYSNQNAAKIFTKYLSQGASKVFNQVFGPFIGVDSYNASFHHVSITILKINYVNLHPEDLKCRFC